MSFKAFEATEDPTNNHCRRRVLLCIPTLNVGGAERAIANLSLSLDRNVFEIRVCVISDFGPMAETLRLAGIPVHILGGRIGRWVEMYRLLRAYRPHIVHAYMFHAALWTALPAWLLRVPKRLYGVRTIPTMNDPKGRLTLLEHIFVLPFINGVTFVSEGARESFMERLRFPVQLTRVIRNGVNLDLFAPDNDRNVSSDLRILAVVGRLAPEKDQSTILHAFHRVILRYPDSQLWLIGDGPIRVELEALVMSLDLSEKVIFWGTITEMPEMYKRMDIFISASLFEGIPNSHLEAMASGKPIVSTKVGGVAEILDDSVAVLVPIHDPDALAAGMLLLLDNPGMARQLGRAARVRVEGQFALEKVAEEHKALYLEGLD